MSRKHVIADLSDPVDRYSSTLVGPIAMPRPPALAMAVARTRGVATVPPRQHPYRKSGLPGPSVLAFDALYPHYVQGRTP